MLMYKDIAREWDRLNALSPEEARALDDTIEDGVAAAIDQFNYQLEEKLFEEAPELNKLPKEESNKIVRAIGNSLFSGYLIFISYQNLKKIKRKPKKGIRYNPTLMDEYNNTMVPRTPNERSEAFNNLLDEEPAAEMLIDKVASIEMNILRKAMPSIETLSFYTGDLIRITLTRAVFIGFGIAFAENSLK
ncbi:MAG: hypothetical protein N2746_02870 [Deltaproteobacteria bacterium]|nr:hypothetical protein [Deltaproteobacteria bacterium]